MSEVRGSSRECQAATAQEQPRGATPRPRSGAAARRSQPALGGATLHPRPGAAARRSNPTSKEQWLCGPVQEGLMELSHVEGQEGQQ